MKTWTYIRDYLVTDNVISDNTCMCVIYIPRDEFMIQIDLHNNMEPVFRISVSKKATGTLVSFFLSGDHEEVPVYTVSSRHLLDTKEFPVKVYQEI